MRIFLAIGIPIALLLSFLIFFNRVETVPIEISNKVIVAEIADTQAKRAKGLMFREHMEYDRGMWFVMDKEGYHSFWMKNTLIPLDIIWVDSDMNIVHIEKNVPPCQENTACVSYKTKAKAKYVLEVNAGWVDDNGVDLGDSVKTL